MTEPHAYHTATLLGNDSDVVLIAGGYQSVIFLSSAYLYHGASNYFIPFGSGVTLPLPRAYHTATYLPPPFHKVLITGGAVPSAYGTMLLFDVASLTFSTLTSNGKVLITGGFNGGSLITCELIDPSNNYTVTSATNLILL